MAKLRSIRGPVGVVAVCGRARQGKSFLLNQLLGRTQGFTVRQPVPTLPIISLSSSPYLGPKVATFYSQRSTAKPVGVSG